MTDKHDMSGYESETPDEWRELQKRWRAILFDMPRAACAQFIRETALSSTDAFATYSVCDLLRYRFDCPDCVLDALDELRALQGHPNAPAEIEAWGERTRAALRRVIGDEAALKPLLN
jgi:hypothetical protein